VKEQVVGYRFKVFVEDKELAFCMWFNDEFGFG